MRENTVPNTGSLPVSLNFGAFLGDFPPIVTVAPALNRLPMIWRVNAPVSSRCNSQLFTSATIAVGQPGVPGGHSPCPGALQVKVTWKHCSLPNPPLLDAGHPAAGPLLTACDAPMFRLCPLGPLTTTKTVLPPLPAV